MVTEEILHKLVPQVTKIWWWPVNKTSCSVCTHQQYLMTKTQSKKSHLAGISMNEKYPCKNLEVKWGGCLLEVDKILKAYGISDQLSKRLVLNFCKDYHV